MGDVDQNQPHPPVFLPDTWTVKEVVADLKADLVDHLDRQDDTLAEISTKVDSKADKADLVVLGVKIDGHGQRITVLEGHKLDLDASARFRKRVWYVVGTVAGILAIVAGSLIAAFVR